LIPYLEVTNNHSKGHVFTIPKRSPAAKLGCTPHVSGTSSEILAEKQGDCKQTTKAGAVGMGLLVCPAGNLGSMGL